MVSKKVTKNRPFPGPESGRKTARNRVKKVTQKVTLFSPPEAGNGLRRRNQSVLRVSGPFPSPGEEIDFSSVSFQSFFAQTGV